MSDSPPSWDHMEGVPEPYETRRLTGHAAVAGFLANAHAAGRLHHAWLLSGPRGIGKATLAYRFACHLLRHPDGAGAPALLDGIDDAIASRIANRSHPNVLTAARAWDHEKKKFLTRLTVDVVRRVNEFLRTSSAERNWRIVVVDSADDMNANAANALLKILEEPPPRTVFMILAHSPQGVLPTLRSRCQVLAMKPLGEGDLRTVLSGLETTREAGEAALNAIVPLASGSVRRALEILQYDIGGVVREFVELSRQAKADWGRVHAIGAALSPAARSRDYELFIDMMFDHISSTARAAAEAGPQARQRLAALADLWQRLREEHGKAMEWNMDRKQVILGLYGDLRRI
ncbi:MAG: DNA polymerase III subunit delta' [Nitratireductor sp.]|nr:DNA polymerase III subunit delta' [Nitratireductor sp.]